MYEDFWTRTAACAGPIAKLESSRYSWSTEKFDTPAILSGCGGLFTLRASSRIPPRLIGGLRPAFRVAKFPRWVSTDADKPEVFSQQTAIASYFSENFCSAVHIPLEKFQYTPCYEYYAQRWNRDGSKEEYAFSGEDVLTAMFVKWNSNDASGCVQTCHY